MISLSLTQTAEYALRAMSALAVDGGKERLNARELAERTRVPLSYLSKIMRNLVSAGLVDASKGHGGGFRLAKAPGRISYLNILEVTGYESARGCVFGWGECRSDKPCPMHDSWSRLNGQFIEWARTTTLASLASTRGRGAARRRKAT